MDKNDKDTTEAREFELAVKAVMASREGRKVLAWVLSQTHQRSSVTNADPIQMAVMSGRRDVGLVVSNTLESLDADHFDLMLKEMRHGSI